MEWVCDDGVVVVVVVIGIVGVVVVGNECFQHTVIVCLFEIL